MASRFATHLRTAPGKAACGRTLTAADFRTELRPMVGRDGRLLEGDDLKARVRFLVTCTRCKRHRSVADGGDR
jgi:hypothetical protein